MPKKAAVENFVCVHCRLDGLNPEQDSDVCIDGVSAHVITAKNVPERTYFLPGAPQQYGRDEHGPLALHDRTIITGIPPTIYPPNFLPGSDDQVLNGGHVTFENNRYTTSDAVEQYWLDKRGGFCTEAEWESAWLSPEELRERDYTRREAALAQGEREVAELRKRAAKGA